MGLVIGLILFGFVLGVVAVVAAEAFGLYLIIIWLGTKAKRDETVTVSTSKSHEGIAELDLQQSLSFAKNKQGLIWVLESDKIPEIPQNKPSKDKRRKNEILEVSPVKKYGKIKGQSLILTDPDGLHTQVPLKGCIVEAVSATNLSSKKWAKKFPIKVESKTSAVYNGRKSFYVYLETSWDKEAWCKALRLASCDKEQKVEWFAQLHEEFRSYLASLNAEYNTFFKPTVGSSVELENRAIKPDGASSKVQKFLKKIAKKSSRVGLDNKSSWSSLSGRDERKNADILLKNASMAKSLRHPVEDNAPLSSSTLSHSRSQSHASISSDVDSDEKFGIDEGTLCWNLLISRFFFDARSNAKLKAFMEAKIQNALASMRTPSYVGEIICTGVHTGSLPPCIVGMRVLPMEMSEVWGFEVDIEYPGGALLDIESRLEVGELDNASGVGDSDRDSPDSVDVSSDLLQGLEDLGKHLNLSDGMGDAQDPKGDDEFNTDISKNVKSTTACSTYGSRWKSIVNSIARQVSQVPFSLTIRITSLRGTLRLQIKPPPSDQLWYSFTSMPDIEFNLESSIGEHKITTGHLALFLINRIKALIRETLVLPNCESICVSWMLAEKDDWVPQEVAPFKWVNQESRKETSTSSDAPTQHPDNASDSSEHKQKKPDSIEVPCRKSADSLTIPSSSTNLPRSRSLDDLTTPLLGDDYKPRETSEQGGEDPQLARNVEGVSHAIERDDSRRKKMGTREKMLDLRKKMSEKFEEKKRHIEEKGRNFVDKMRERERY
ncbi:uncharacterized protein LOC129320334 [Prosopis cineraria]|uniref:uncharacterized protein LOC129320334 n=1 Tax=Prosopis cineraria TaxID=364024 RepID=UPI00240F3312|nr:uncharacterized protein LOC129320334 [Prosopis cineraria]